MSLSRSRSRFGCRAAVTLTNLIATITALLAKDGSRPHLTALARHLQLVAHHQVRDVGSWVGNVMLAKSHPDFPSDVVLCLVR